MRSCLLGWPTSCRGYSHRVVRTNILRPNYKHIQIDHHHVQLALKYTRLQCRKYNSYLQALIAPYHDINSFNSIPARPHNV
ncbi:hypothetical protein F5X96DRAFT_658040 [Biscogniauxia mediterranea]|nr:hypothetical protein F5X96DRAFT_658040 [Biscogniauxia mediterranea]